MRPVAVGHPEPAARLEAIAAAQTDNAAAWALNS